MIKKPKTSKRKLLALWSIFSSWDFVGLIGIIFCCNFENLQNVIFICKQSYNHCFFLVFTSIYFTSLSTSKSKQIEGVFNVISGDSIALNGTIYQLEGIKAPSSLQKCKKGLLPWLCGAAAKRFLSKTIRGTTLVCVLKKVRTVKCLIQKGDLATLILKAGWAVTTSKEGTLKAAELYAWKNRLGLWTGN